LKYIQNKLEERYENFWNNLLSQNTGNENIWGRNKLVRTYHKLKANFEAEKYLYTDVDKCSISTFVIYFSISDISGKEGITNDKLSKRSPLYALSLGQCMIK
jgi:hypothetical protein